MEMRVSDIARKFDSAFIAFCPFPAATDREAYETLPAHIKQEIVAEGERYLGYEYPVIRATDFMNFKRTGNRVAYEDLFFARRHALNGLLLAECVEYKGRFLDDIINGIFVICEESGWQLPPHNSYIRDTPQLILPDATNPVVDLFAAETGALLALASTLLKDALDEVSPFIVTRIQHELSTRIITPYLTRHFWWMGKGEEPMCNWTVWCTQNVLLTAFLGAFDDQTRRAVFQKAAASCDYFLKDYGDDGCCDEGAQYYRHAGLCLFGALDILNRVSGGCFVPLFQWEKIQNIASYILNVHVDDKYYFNFADCSPVAGRAGVREFLFGKATDQEALMHFAARDFQTEGRLYTDEVNQINLYYRLKTLFTYEEIVRYDASAPILHKDIFYPSVGLFIVHDGVLSLAVKAGDNDDSHNHNDTGSLTLYKNGKPVLVDIGVESYTQKTFSPNRYEIWTMQSGYHNLPTINGTDEKDGSSYCATNVKVELTGSTPNISMELATAYPLSDVSYSRSVSLDKQTHTVHVQDNTNAKQVILNFITYEKPQVTENRIRIGSLAEAHISGAELLTVETLPITDARLQTAWDHDLYRIRLTMTGNEFHMDIQ